MHFSDELPIAFDYAYRHAYDSVTVWIPDNFFGEDDYPPYWNAVAHWLANDCLFPLVALLRTDSIRWTDENGGGWFATIALGHSDARRPIPFTVYLSSQDSHEQCAKCAFSEWNCRCDATQECPRCDGLGEVCVSRDDRAKECSRCKGTGVVPVPVKK